MTDREPILYFYFLKSYTKVFYEPWFTGRDTFLNVPEMILILRSHIDVYWKGPYDSALHSALFRKICSKMIYPQMILILLFCMFLDPTCKYVFLHYLHGIFLKLTLFIFQHKLCDINNVVSWTAKVWIKWHWSLFYLARYWYLNWIWLSSKIRLKFLLVPIRKTKIV